MDFGLDSGEMSGRPAMVGPYRLTAPLGEGGMGTVWRAWDDRLKRSVALKRVRAGATAGTHLRQRLRLEAQAAARISHPAIVQVYDLVETEEGDWIVLELIEGETLFQILTAGPLDLAPALELGSQIALGLAEAHAQGLLHRDLKTLNVMVTRAGRAKILDFGLVKELEPAGDDLELSVPGTILGTLHSMSPEQVRGDSLDARSDLFSLGALLYEVVAGYPPFRAENATASLARVLSFWPPPLTQVRPGVPRELADLISRLLEKDRFRRPQSAREVAVALADLAAAAPGRVVPSPPPDLENTLGGAEAAWTSAEPLLNRAPVEPPPASASPSSGARRRQIGERRMVSVLCFGLAGRDEGSADEPALEALSEIMPACERLAREVAGRRDGHFGAVWGNFIWLCFGYPRAHEDDARRALFAADELSARLADLIRLPDGYGDPRLVVRSAVHTGPAVVLVRQDEDELLQLGSTLDVAGALARMAPPGTTLVSGPTRRLIAASFATEPMEPVRLTGSSSPIEVFRVLDRVDPHQGDSGVLLPLVGRRQELALLVDRLAQVRRGAGQIVLISGEAGIGKSRLVRALREEIAIGSEPFQWLSGYGSPDQQSSPLFPFLDLLARAIFPPTETTAGRKLERLEAFLETYGVAPADSLPLLALHFSLPLEGRMALPELAPDVLRQKTLEALAGLFVALAEREPLILLLEDLHWFDPSSLNLLGLLLGELDSLPLFLVVTGRPDLSFPAGQRAQLIQLGLSPLSEEESRDLLAQVAGESPLSAEVRRQIVARTDGIPLFVEELTRAVLEVPPGDSRPTALPATLRSSLEARLDHLGEAKEVAQLASVLGRTFSLELLAAVAPLPRPALEEGLAALVRAQLVFRRARGRGERYVFRHSLIQDAAYASLLQRDRRSLHLKVAAELEAEGAGALGGGVLMGNEDSGHLSALAYHLRQAVDLEHPEPELIERAVAACIAASEQALQLNAYQEAHAHLEAAMPLVQALPAGSTRDDRELVLLVRTSTILRATRGWTAPEVKAAYDRGRELCGRLGERPELPQILFGLSCYHWARGEYETSFAVAEECLELAQTTRLYRLMAHCALANSLFWLCRLPETLRHAETVLTFDTAEHGACRATLGFDPRIHALQFSIWSLWLMGRPADATVRHKAMQGLVERLAHPFTSIMALCTTVNFHRDRQDVEACAQATQSMLALARQMGFPTYEISANIAHHASLVECHPEQAAERVEEILRNLEDFTGFMGEIALTVHCTLTATVCFRAGRHDEAFAVLERGLAAAARNRERVYEAELHCLMGELLVELAARPPAAAAPERWSRAEQAFTMAFHLACERLQVPLAERAARGLEALLAARGDTAGAAPWEDLAPRWRRLLDEAPARAGEILADVGAVIESWAGD